MGIGEARTFLLLQEISIEINPHVSAIDAGTISSRVSKERDLMQPQDLDPDLSTNDSRAFRRLSDESLKRARYC